MQFLFLFYYRVEFIRKLNCNKKSSSTPEITQHHLSQDRLLTKTMYVKASKAILRQRSLTSTARSHNNPHHHHHQQQHQNHQQQFQFDQSSSNTVLNQVRASLTETMNDDTSNNDNDSTLRDFQSTDNNNSTSQTADNTTTATAPCPPPVTTDSGSAPTPTAASIAPSFAAAAGAPPPVPTADTALLRDWSTGSQAPPVAPAVVLNETSGSSQTSAQQSRAYGYPVATYVSNFVRTSVNEIRDHFEHVLAIPEENVVSSVRSEPALVATAPAAAAASSNRVMDTMRSLDALDSGDDQIEPTFLIDGEMVILEQPDHQPRRHRHRRYHQNYHDNHQSPMHDSDDTHDDLRSAASSSYAASSQDQSYSSQYHHHQSEMEHFYNQQDRSSCHRPSRMKRGVKGLKKWVGKGKKMIGKRVSKQQVREQMKKENSERSAMTGDSGEISMANSQISSLSRRDDESILTTSTGSQSPGRNAKKNRKKKNRRWVRDACIETHDEDAMDQVTTIGAAAPPSLQQMQRSHPPAQEQQIQQEPQLQPLEIASGPASPPNFASIEPASPPSVAVAPATVAPNNDASATATAAVAEVAAIDHDASFSHRDLLGSPDQHPSFHRAASIAAEASFVGNADTLYLEAGVLPDSIAAEAYIEDRIDDYDKYDEENLKKDGGFYPRSMVPANADFKVDKQDAPCVDSMLRRAGEFAREISTESEPSVTESVKTAASGKSEGESVPLSMATSTDEIVHNDVLKLVMVGDSTVDKAGIARAIRKSSKKAKKRSTLAVDVHSWAPPNEDSVKFTIWDVQGANSTPYAANFGAHPGTQSLFFSDRGLYLLVWDLASENPRTFRAGSKVNDDSDSDSDEDEDNEFFREEANRQADRALQTDIEERVLSWVDCIARRGANSAILPVALVPQHMSPEECKRRCDIMQTLLMEHTNRKLAGDLPTPKVLSGVDTVICVNLETNMGMEQLEETVLAIATDASHSVFDHVGTPVPKGTVAILETIRRLKQNHKLVLVDHIMGENDKLGVEEVMEALHFLAGIGEVLYFGGMDEVLSQYVILSRKWLVSALSCILRNDLRKELSETRRFMNMQCLYSDQQFPENHVVQTFSSSHSTCPLLSSLDTQMLWQSMSFMREAADQTAELNENSTTALTMFGFLQHLLVHTGVFLPLDIDRFSSPDNVYFVPSLLAQIADSRDVWTFKSNEAWMTTLCHSWLFRDGAPLGLVERVASNLLRDLYEFSHIVAKPQPGLPPRSNTFPLGHDSMNEFMDNHDGEPVGHIKIHQIMCWKSSLLVKIGCVFSDGAELRESFVEIFVSITDQSSPYCVASDAMRANMQRLVVSGKGQVGHHGRKLWKGGYGLVLDSIKASLSDCTNVDRQVVCPECLAQSYPSSASTWSWDSVRAAAESGSAVVRCMRGHRVDSHLICGAIKPALPKSEIAGHSSEQPKKPVRELLPSVVVVGLWDPISKNIVTVGSGFVANKKLGLIITAGHTIFQMKEGPDFGMPFCGSKTPKAVIGVINPDGGGGGGDVAVFRYFAECVADDVHSVDACVLQITSKLKDDVVEESLIGEQPEIPVFDPVEEQLPVLKMTARYELEETVRILGFNQGGEGILERGKHVNRSADFAKGYICKQFKIDDDDSTSSNDDDSTTSSSEHGFSPREEIVIMCPTISGHSGGPCVNDEGKVVGILSRADPVDRQRCYLVPTSELKILVSKAKNHASRRVGDLKPRSAPPRRIGDLKMHNDF